MMEEPRDGYDDNAQGSKDTEMKKEVQEESQYVEGAAVDTVGSSDMKIVDGG
jgi:chaperonin GroEL (HSP60 family)